MAETILAELLKTVAEKLGSQAYNKIVYANDIDSQITELQDVKNTLEATLLDADSVVCSHSQLDVLEKLKNGLAKIIHFQDAKAAKAKQQELIKGSKFTKKATTQDFNVKNVLQKILASATDKKRLECEMDQLQHRLFGAIAGKKFLLVLDGIWVHDSLRAKWLELRSLLGVGAQGSKVLLTTRSDTVARKIGNHEPYMLCYLQEEECWLLFQHIAYTQWHEPGLEAIGKEIAEMCPKVPLVIRAIGSLLAGKLTAQEWGVFRNDQLTNFASYGCDVMGTLKLSYDELGRELKLCVAFCSLFPKGLQYEKSYLIHLWITMGYVKPEYANQSLEEVAEGYVLCLKKREFFKHNMSNALCMHELVLSIAGFKYKVADSTIDEFDERVCHVSYWPFANLLEEPWKVPSSLFKIKQLQSFLLPLPSPGLRFIDHVGIFKHDVFLSSFFPYLK